ncbi:hypothetical protein Y032_0019g3946 [Ancylostoma ceylanicum]|uniref:Uncharacterized protein n=2 Tax=Ancylostoma ceylanicum TaxID=53326 RepID=A0A016V2I9_9BILA|nr:hypothetical protein Y032_0019g3946 [Ancylostoma ceylanicum]
MNISSNELRSKRTLVVEVVETFAPYDELESQYAPPNIVNTSDQLLLHFIPAFLKPANVEQSSSCGRQVQCVHVVVNLVMSVDQPLLLTSLTKNKPDDTNDSSPVATAYSILPEDGDSRDSGFVSDYKSPVKKVETPLKNAIRKGLTDRTNTIVYPPESIQRYQSKYTAIVDGLLPFILPEFESAAFVIIR